MAADTCRCWAERGHEVVLATLGDEARRISRLDPRVERVSLGFARLRTVRDLLAAVRACRRLIRRVEPEVVVGFGSDAGLVFGLAGLGLPPRRITCQFGVPWRPRRLPTAWILRAAFGLPDAVVAESEAAEKWLRRRSPARRTFLVPKSLQWPLAPADPGIDPAAVCRPGRVIVLAVGRLVQVKGFDVLLRAFATLAVDRPDWDLVILGDGAARGGLEALRNELGLGERAHLPGESGDPGAWYRHAGLLAVSSRWEGGPNVLIEALAHGLPAIAFDCEVGPATILRDGVDGLLVPPGDEGAFAVGLARLMDDAQLRGAMAERAVEARDRFSEESAMRRWGEVFRDLGLT